MLNCDRKIITADEFKLTIKVKPDYPLCQVDGILEQKLKDAMAKRYVQATNALDLSAFHYDTELVNDYICALSTPRILTAVFNIVAKEIPNLVALNLDNNKFHTLDQLKIYTKKFVNLKILYIGGNKVSQAL